MRARDLVGKTIKRVVHYRYTEKMGAHGGDFYALERLEFTDGSMVLFTAIETEEDPRTMGTFFPKRPATK